MVASLSEEDKIDILMLSEVGLNSSGLMRKLTDVLAL